MRHAHGLSAVSGGLTPGWSPAALSNLWAWFDASRLGGAADAPVDVWPDLSGNNRHALQDTAGLQPLKKVGILNGLPVVRFDGIDNFLTITDGTSPQVYSIYIAYCNRANTNGAFFGETSAVAGSTLQRNGEAFHDAGGASITYSGGATLNASKLFEAHYNFTTDNFEVVIDGTSRGTSSASSTTSQTLRLGRGYDTEYLAGDIAEIAIVSAVSGAPERTLMRSYLNAKWVLY